MTFVAGIDPGTGGAIAVYCTESARLVCVEDIPFYYKTTGKRKKKRIDTLALRAVFERLKLLGVELIVLEEVGGLPRQSASSAFAFGFSTGLIYMAMMYTDVAVHTVRPAAWKGMMGVPGKARGSADDVMSRADEMFPKDRKQFRGDRGGRLMDRAEAAMLAKFGGDFVLPSGAEVEKFSFTYKNK